MFWKRKKTDTPLCYIDSDDKRSAFRVPPHNKLPVDITVDGRLVKIIDIGAGGMSFRNIDCKQGGLHHAVMRLAGHDADISADIYIINIDRNDICHCIFKKIKGEDVEAIHKYVLEVQKQEIRERRQLKILTY